jgi:hypothetical protein
MKHKLQDLKKVLRKLFKPKRDELSGEWWKLRNKKFCDLCTYSSVVGVDKLGRL